MKCSAQSAVHRVSKTKVTRDSSAASASLAKDSGSLPRGDDIEGCESSVLLESLMKLPHHIH